MLGFKCILREKPGSSGLVGSTGLGFDTRLGISFLFFPRTDYSHCSRIQSALCLDDAWLKLEASWKATGGFERILYEVLIKDISKEHG